MNSIAWVEWVGGRKFYVAQVKGDGGVDWGYTPDIKQAIELSAYWQRRFAADCRYCGYTARFPAIEAANLLKGAA